MDVNQIQWKERIATAIVCNDVVCKTRSPWEHEWTIRYNNIRGPAASSGIIIRLETPYARSLGHNLNLTWLVTTWQRNQRSWFCGNYNDGQRKSPFDNLASPVATTVTRGRSKHSISEPFSFMVEEKADPYRRRASRKPRVAWIYIGWGGKRVRNF